MDQLSSFGSLIIQIYKFMIMGRVLLSFIPHNPQHPIIGIIYSITEPILGLFRRFMPRNLPLDFSPILAFLLLDFIGRSLR